MILVNVVSVSLFLFWASMRVGSARKKHGVKLPKMYDDKNDST